ncbi:MAG: ATP-binding protein [Pyrobaculum sp.]|jgi:hypothetical protein
MALKPHEEMEFRRRWRDDLPLDVIERCLEEARAVDNIFRAYACAVEHYLAQQQRPQKKKPLLELPKERRLKLPRLPKAERLKIKEVGEAKAEPKGKPSFRRLPWQAYAAFASLLLLAANPVFVFAALPAAALLSLWRNTAPLWTEGDSLVWNEKRFKFYKVERVFKDVAGMGPSEFNNHLISTLHEINGIYYERGQAWILLEEGADVEAARTVLRRFGVVVEPQPSPPPIALPREPASKYLPWAVLPFLAGLAGGPAAAAAAVLPAMFIGALTFRDVGCKPAPPLQPLTSNASYYSVPDNEAVLSIAMASQPLVEAALVVWVHDPYYTVRLEKRGTMAERIAQWTQSWWRLQRLDIVHVARQRIYSLHEKGFAVNGLINGKVATFAAGRPVARIDAFTRDLAPFSPWALLMSPSVCREDSIVAGQDDAGRDVCINPEELKTPHMLAVGKTGAGKTTLGLSIAVQLRQKRGAVPVVVDPHGHWAQLSRWFPDVQIIDARRYAPPLVLRDENDADGVLDTLRAAGVHIYDAHFTVLFEALRRAAQEGDASLGNVLKHLRQLRADPAFAFAVDSIYGRLSVMAQMQPAKIDLSRPIVVHSEGDTSPSSVMKLALWIIYFAVAAKAACPKPPCGMRMLLAIDEGHVLLKNMDALAKTWREVRKFGVEAAVFSQSVADIPRDILENSGVKFVLAIEPEAVPETAARLHIDPSRLQRVAYEGLPEERVGLARVEARSPIFIKIYPPPEK